MDQFRFVLQICGGYKYALMAAFYYLIDILGIKMGHFFFNGK